MAFAYEILLASLEKIQGTVNETDAQAAINAVELLEPTAIEITVKKLSKTKCNLS